MPIDQSYVKPDGKERIFSRQINRMFAGKARDHEAGAGQNSTAVSQDYGFIDLSGGPEIISVYYQTAGFHISQLPKAGVRSGYAFTWLSRKRYR